MYELRHYIDPEGQDLFARWLDHLGDRVALARVAARLLRLQNGNFGDCKPVGSGCGSYVWIGGQVTGFTTLFLVSEWFCSARVATSGRNPGTLHERSSAGTNGKQGVIDENLRKT